MDVFKVIEIDTMTGWKQYLNNMNTDPWRDSFTRAEAEACVEWRKENITARYAYEIVAVQPYMTDNDEARRWHRERHGSYPMRECSDVDCREADARMARASGVSMPDDIKELERDQ
jgi:hypothetical protein